MRKLAALLALLFLLVDVYAFLIWWTHPKGARAMGLPRAGTLPFELPFHLPLVTLPAGGSVPLPPPGAPPEMPAERPARAARRTEPEPAPRPPAEEAPAAGGGGYDLDADPFRKYE